jgi:hypothetical protein
MPAKASQDARFHEGSDVALYYEVETASELNFSTCSALWYRLGASVTPAGGDVQKSLGSGITVVSEASHQPGITATVPKAKVTIAAANTAGLGGTTTGGVAYYHELRAVNASGASGVVAYGSVTILPSSTG